MHPACLIALLLVLPILVQGGIFTAMIIVGSWASLLLALSLVSTIIALVLAAMACQERKR